jgi:hypothetical protein
VLRRQIVDRPYGYNVGSFIFHAQAEAGIEYDDNIFRSNNFAGNPAPVSDVIARVAPQVSLQSDWDQHAIGIAVGSEFDFYFNNPSQNYINYNGGINGRYDIDEEQQITGLVQYYRQVLPRGTPGVGVTGGQSFTNVLSADAKYLYTGEPWYLRIGPKYEYRTFEGTAPSANYNYFGFSARVGYRVTEDFSVFIDPTLQIYRYPGGVDFTGFDPNSQGYDIKAGVTYDLGSEVGLEAAIGYYQQYYQSGALPPSSGLSFNLALYWNPTEDWSFEVSGGRGFSQYRIFTSGVPNGNAVVTQVQGRVGWLPTYNLLVDAGAGFAIYEFQDVSQNTNYFGGDVGARYFFNENYWIGPRYFYTQSTASNPALPYIDNRIMLTVGARL